MFRRSWGDPLATNIRPIHFWEFHPPYSICRQYVLSVGMPFKNPHPLYQVWRGMRDRCRNPNNRQWNDYGGRGITICTRWDDFHAFVKDMGLRPKGYSLDRIDNDQGYSPENCRWASRKTQQRNQRRAVYVIIEGVRYRAIELAEKIGVKTDTIVDRAKRGLSLAEVLSSTALYSKDTRKAVAGRKRVAKERTHCRNGHLFDEANTQYTVQGYKRCRACNRARVARQNKT